MRLTYCWTTTCGNSDWAGILPCGYAVDELAARNGVRCGASTTWQYSALSGCQCRPKTGQGRVPIPGVRPDPPLLGPGQRSSPVSQPGLPVSELTPKTGLRIKAKGVSELSACEAGPSDTVDSWTNPEFIRRQSGFDWEARAPSVCGATTSVTGRQAGHHEF